MEENSGPILHVLVVGFHHKKGCQVEYSFPSLVPNAPNECPPGWKYLPTLALPDGSHNYDEDTAYFHLPSLNDPKKTVYGISCYRQIPAEKLKNRTEDITRSTVQKAVCVLSTLPFYGHIQVKMSLITHAYFEEGDFSKVSLLEDTYHHLNSCLNQTQSTTQVYVGLSARDLILQWRHKALLLFKLLLLERRVIFYRSPVQPLCSTILTLLSLHPGMIERGLHESACVKPSRPMSPIPDFGDTPEEFPIKENVSETLPESDVNTISNKSPTKEDIKSVQENPEPSESFIQTANSEADVETIGDQNTEKTDAEKIDIGESSSDLGNRDEKSTLPRDSSIDNINEMSAQNTMSAIAHVDAESCGTPLSVFTKGYMCLPYLSLPYIDLLSDVNVRGYVVGATNVLFKQKRQLADVLIEVEGARIESQDPELRRQLHLTTEDLRFADFVVKHVAEEKHDVFLDGVGWEGGDEWIRTQFRVYLLCLLRTSLLQEGSRECEHFNSSFITAWKETHNYKIWLSGKRSGILELNPGHPFAGQLSVADMKLRFAHTMQNTEGGRKLNQAMMSTGKAVATTGRAVGGAWTQAKGALSSWWSNLTTVSPEMEQNPPCEGEVALESSLDDNNVAQNVIEVNINNQCMPTNIDNCNTDDSTHIPNSNSDNMNANPSNGEIINSESKKIDIENETLYKPGEINTV